MLYSGGKQQSCVKYPGLKVSPPAPTHPPEVLRRAESEELVVRGSVPASAPSAAGELGLPTHCSPLSLLSPLSRCSKEEKEGWKKSP